MNLVNVRTALADAAGTIADLETSPVPRDSIAPPMFMVGDIETRYDASMGGGLEELNVSCWLYVARATDDDGHNKVSAYVARTGTSSIRAAINAVRKTTAAWSDCHVRSAKTGVVADIAGNPYFGAEFTIYIIGSGS